MATYTKTITSDAYIWGVATINSNSYIKKLAISNTINSNSYIKHTYGGKSLRIAYSSLVSLYRMDEPDWAGVPGEVIDEKGNSNGAAMGSATTDRGLFNRAGIFSGSDTGINCGANSTFHTNHISVNVWVYPTVATNNYNDIVNSGRYRIILRSSRKVEFWAYSTEAGWIQAISNSTIDLNKWTLITCTYDGTAKLYINGILQTITGTGGGNLAWAGNTIYIGQSGGNTNEYTGKIDDIGFWNAVLTQNEIDNIWKEFTFLFTDSNIKIFGAKIINSDNYIKKSATQPINSNAYIKKLTSKTLNSNSKIKKVAVEKTINSNSWIKEIQSSTIDLNYELKQTYTKTLNSNFKIKKPGTEGAINSNYYIKKLGTEKTIVSNTYLSKSYSNALNSDYYITKEGIKTIISNYYIKKLDNSKILTSNYYIKKISTQTTISCAMIIKTITTAPIYTNSFILKVSSKTLSLDWYIKKSATQSINSNSYIKKLAEQIIILDSYILKSNSKTIVSNCIIQTFPIGSINLNYYIKKLDNIKILSSDAVLKLGGQFSLNSNYVIMEEGEWSEEWEVEIVIPKSKTIISDSKIKQEYTKTINSNSYIKRPAYEGGIILNSYIKQAYTNVLNSIYYIRRTDTTKPYVYTAKYINKPIIISANTLSYTNTII